MWDDVVIGKGNKGCSAILCFQIEGNHSISENSNSYWISDVYLDMGMTIIKSTREGRKLKSMIDKKIKLEKIIDYLQKLLFKNVNYKVLMQKISNSQKDSYEDGKEAKREELLNVLGISKYY